MHEKDENGLNVKKLKCRYLSPAGLHKAIYFFLFLPCKISGEARDYDSRLKSGNVIKY